MYAAAVKGVRQGRGGRGFAASGILGKSEDVKMEIIQIHVDDIIPYENNPRDNDGAVDAVAASIAEFGFKVPVVVDKDNIIVAGHTRHKAAKKLGLEWVPCIKADDLTEEQVKAFRLADNKTAELASWDFAKLEEELAGLELDMEQFGFEGEYNRYYDNIDDLFTDAPEKEKTGKTAKCPHCGEVFEI